jgi:KDO2-lipid IV(A) lauroyltransferase
MKKGLNSLGYYLLVGGCKAVGALPYGFLYRVLAPVIYFFVYRVGRYRRAVTRENLRKSFPEKSEDQRLAIERKFYRQLAELFVDTLALTAISEKEIRSRFRYLNAEEQQERTVGKSWICAMAHYGSWEYTINYPLFTDHRVGAVYRPLHSEVFDRFYAHVRSRFGAIPLAMDHVAREMIRTQNESLPPIALALIADQTPLWFTIRHWFDFLNQPTAFFMGTEKLALKFGLPVYFLRVEKIKPGYYTARFEELYDGAEPVAEYEITARYAARLEQAIRQHPELWLWSHKRWKHKAPSRM